MLTKWAPFLAGIALGAGSVALLLHEGHSQPTASAPPREERCVAGARVPAAAVPAPNLREAVRAADMEARATARTDEQLAQFFAELEARARHQNEVTAVEIAAGLGALAADPDHAPEAEAAFVQRMERLASELAAKRPANPAAAAESVRTQLGLLGTMLSGAERDRTVQLAVQAIRALPPEAQDRALLELERVNGSKTTTADTNAGLDVGLAEIANADTPKARAQQVRHFLGQVAALPEDAQTQWLKQLDEETSAIAASEKPSP